jgi:hypothetical protein
VSNLISYSPVALALTIDFAQNKMASFEGALLLCALKKMSTCSLQKSCPKKNRLPLILADLIGLKFAKNLFKINEFLIKFLSIKQRLGTFLAVLNKF